eukprot:scaffold4947_cov269-Prasinococcus_capsulatus_cf.AAC.1
MAKTAPSSPPPFAADNMIAQALVDAALLSGSMDNVAAVVWRVPRTDITLDGDDDDDDDGDDDDDEPQNPPREGRRQKQQQEDRAHDAKQVRLASAAVAGRARGVAREQAAAPLATLDLVMSSKYVYRLHELIGLLTCRNRNFVPEGGVQAAATTAASSTPSPSPPPSPSGGVPPADASAPSSAPYVVNGLPASAALRPSLAAVEDLQRVLSDATQLLPLEDAADLSEQLAAAPKELLPQPELELELANEYATMLHAWALGERFARGSFGEVWRGARVGLRRGDEVEVDDDDDGDNSGSSSSSSSQGNESDDDGDANDDDDRGPDRHKEGVYVLKRILAMDEARAMSGWREAHFGALLNRHFANAHRANVLFARFEEMFTNRVRHRPPQPPRSANEGGGGEGDEHDEDGGREELVQELWLVFRDEGTSLDALLYSNDHEHVDDGGGGGASQGRLRARRSLACRLAPSVAT